jgi:hypothetical protein
MDSEARAANRNDVTSRRIEPPRCHIVSVRDGVALVPVRFPEA